MVKLNYPTLFCHNLTIDKYSNITDYNIRINEQKKEAVKAFRRLNYHVIAFGDSYNDVKMIQEANKGFFFQPPDSVVSQFPDIPVTRDYSELKTMIKKLLAI